LTLFAVGMCLRVTTESESEKRDMEIKKESIKMMEMMKMTKMKRGKEKDEGERR
jgi:hypothetical protein